MRSPWKVFTGFVSRRDPEIEDVAADEISAAPNPKAEEPDVQAAEHSRIVSFQSHSSNQSAEDRPAERVALAEVASNPSLAESAEPVLATTIRLMTSDRLSVRAALPESLAVPLALEAAAQNVAVDAASNAAAVTETTSHPSEVTEEQTSPVEPPPTAKVDPIDNGRPKRIARIGSAISKPISHGYQPIQVDASGIGSEDSSNRDALELDGEITQLRVQLAEKLRQQNEHLKGLLLRYENR